MKNREFIFGEKRFVFGDPVPGKATAKGGPEVQVATVPLSEGVEAAAKAKEASKASLTLGTGQKLAESKTKMKLEELEQKLGADVFKEFLTATNLEGMDITREIYSDDLNFESEDLLSGLIVQIKGRIPKSGLEKFATYINTEPAKVQEVVTEIYARTFLSKTKVEFDTKYPRFSDFIKEVKPNKFPIQFTIKPDASGKATVSFGELKEKAKYQEWKANQPSAETKTPAGTPQGQEGAVGTEQAEALAQFSQTKLGKIFSFLKDENGKSLLERMAAGGGIMGAIIAGLFGFSKVSGGVYESIVEMLPASIKDKVKAVEKKARETPLSAESAAKSAEGTYQEVDANGFAAIVKSKVIPEKGIRLAEDYLLRRGTLQVNLSEKKGGKMILPEEASLTIDGNPVKIEEGKIQTYDSNDTPKNPLLITGKIPKSTIFQGDVVLAFASATAGQTAKASDKPKGDGTAKIGQDAGEKTGKAAEAGTGTGEASGET